MRKDELQQVLDALPDGKPISLIVASHTRFEDVRYADLGEKLIVHGHYERQHAPRAQATERPSLSRE